MCVALIVMIIICIPLLIIGIMTIIAMVMESNNNTDMY